MLPASVDVPPSGGGGEAGTMQLPCSEPGGTTHWNPVQQSAVVVQTPFCGTQLALLHFR